MNHHSPPPLPDEESIWGQAQRRCWSHVEVATQMMRTLESLKGCNALSVIPILSDVQPSIMITPDRADDLLAIKATCRYIKECLLTSAEWSKLSINDTWLLRLKHSNVTIDLMTRLPATKESPIEL
jgi:hypothetical protein